MAKEKEKQDNIPLTDEQIKDIKSSHKMDVYNLGDVPAGPAMFDPLNKKFRNKMLEISALNPLAAFVIENAPAIFAEAEKLKAQENL